MHAAIDPVLSLDRRTPASAMQRGAVTQRAAPSVGFHCKAVIYRRLPTLPNSVRNVTKLPTPDGSRRGVVVIARANAENRGSR